jgi:hypothetical protein
MLAVIGLASGHAEVAGALFQLAEFGQARERLVGVIDGGDARFPTDLHRHDLSDGMLVSDPEGFHHPKDVLLMRHLRLLSPSSPDMQSPR